MADNKTNYLAKLLTLLIKRSNNQIRVPIQDLVIDDTGQGFQVYYDQDAKELVLTYVPAGTTIYKIEGATTWLNQNLLSPLPLPTASKPLSQEELVSRVWSESAATLTGTEDRHPPKRNKVVTLTTEGMAEAEIAKAKARVIREIESYQSPQPSVSRTIPSSQAILFSKP